VVDYVALNAIDSQVSYVIWKRLIAEDEEPRMSRYFFSKKTQRFCVSFCCIERVCTSLLGGEIKNVKCSVHIPGGWQDGLKTMLKI
jgi:hypothetical protein